MGTQQLLLIVLVAIIVAVAIAVGLIYFQSQQQETDINETINELNHIGATAQGWYRKPLNMAGGGESFAAFTLSSISEPDSNDIAVFKVLSTSAESFQIQAAGYQDFTITVTIFADSIGPYSVIR